MDFIDKILGDRQKNANTGELEPIEFSKKAKKEIDTITDKNKYCKYVWSKYQENIGKVGTIRSDFLKGLRDNKDSKELLKMFIEYIYMTTDDIASYKAGLEYLEKYKG